jgi:hypothetical protein
MHTVIFDAKKINKSTTKDKQQQKTTISCYITSEILFCTRQFTVGNRHQTTILHLYNAATYIYLYEV